MSIAAGQKPVNADWARLTTAKAGNRSHHRLARPARQMPPTMRTPATTRTRDSMRITFVLFYEYMLI
jgi:hypothetical protein